LQEALLLKDLSESQVPDARICNLSSQRKDREKQVKWWKNQEQWINKEFIHQLFWNPSAIVWETVSNHSDINE
jgi:hypothetical protein